MRLNTVVVADDHTIVREGLVGLLREHHFDVLGSVGDGHTLLEAARHHRPDVIVTDISMPGLSGLEAIPHLKSASPDSRVIVLTMHEDADLAVRALRAGASGFLLKHSAGEELVNAVRQALHGRVYLTPVLARDVMARMAAGAVDEVPRLTPRQLEVLRLVLEGKRMKEIGAILQLSRRTVEAHKYELMNVLDVHSTAELVKYAIQHRLIDY
jgi:DNA-binding NarL/FixJ family response regulator